MKILILDSRNYDTFILDLGTLITPSLYYKGNLSFRPIIRSHLMDSFRITIPHKYCTRDHPRVYPKSPHPGMKAKARVSAKEWPV